MRGKRLLETAVLLATFGGAVLAVVAVKGLVGSFHSLSWYYKFMVAAGIVTVAASALIAMAIAFVQAIRSTSNQLAWTEYLVGRVRQDELEQFHGFCRSVVGDEVASLQRLRQWHQKNPDTIYAVYREQRRPLKRRREMVGFFSVFPMTKQATELLSKNQLKGTELGPNQILSYGRRPAAIYIGAVGAKGFRARERTLGALMGHVASLSRKTPLIFTRPVTNDGLRLARQQGFEPVLKTPTVTSSADGSMIFVRNFTSRGEVG